MKTTKVNRNITAKRVLLIDAEGRKLGVFLTRDAMNKASEDGLDLVQVSQEQEIPVCKIMDYGKLLYDQKKRQKASKTSKVQTKEIRLGATTEENDVNVRIKAANKFIAKGHKVKFAVKVYGRDNAHRDLVIKKLEEILEKIEGGVVESKPSFSGNLCTALIVPA